MRIKLYFIALSAALFMFGGLSACGKGQDGSGMVKEAFLALPDSLYTKDVRQEVLKSVADTAAFNAYDLEKYPNGVASVSEDGNYMMWRNGEGMPIQVRVWNTAKAGEKIVAVVAGGEGMRLTDRVYFYRFSPGAGKNSMKEARDVFEAPSFGEVADTSELFNDELKGRYAGNATDWGNAMLLYDMSAPEDGFAVSLSGMICQNDEGGQENVSPYAFLRRTCKWNGEKFELAPKDLLTSGQWNCSDPEHNGMLIIRFSAAGNMRVINAGYMDVAAIYDGSYERQDGDRYSFTLLSGYPMDEKKPEEFSGNFSMKVADDGLLHFTSDRKIPECCNAGKEYVLYQRGSDVPVSLGSLNPTVLDLLKAVGEYQITDFPVRNAYDYITTGKNGNTIEGTPDTQVREQNLKNGFLYYADGRDASTELECRRWNCDGGEEVLLAVNEKSRMFGSMLTVNSRIFIFNVKRGTIREVEPASVGFVTPDGNTYRVDLPRGDNGVMVIVHTKGVDDPYAYYLHWNGKGFDKSDKD